MFSSTQKLPDKDNAALVPGDSINVKTFYPTLATLTMIPFIITEPTCNYHRAFTTER